MYCDVLDLVIYFRIFQFLGITMIFYLFIIALDLASALNEKVILYTRHGARSPKTYTEIDSKYLWRTVEQDLTFRGLGQHTNLGSRFRSYVKYDDNEKCIYESLEIQASTTQRVVMSTIGFIKGLCPLNYQEILNRFFIEYYQQYSLDPIKFQAILESDFSDPLSLDLHIFDRDNDFMFHGHKKANCPLMKTIQKSQEKSTYYKNFWTQTQNSPAFDEVVRIIQEANPSKTIAKKDVAFSDLEDLQDDYYANSFHGYKFPAPSSDAISLIESVTKTSRYYVDNSQQDEHYAQLTEPFKWTISQLKSTGTFSWYSGHDSNQVAILSVLVDEQYIVPFASALQLLVDGNIVNVVYNDEILKTKICSEGINCTVDQTIEFLSQYISSDLNKLCNQ
ncbi:hypothetical protein pb186bvf_017516 [Paramecium bursaria]